MKYPVAIHKEKDSSFGVTVPDLPGCFSAGDSVEEALANTKEAIQDHVQILIEDGLPVPVPSEHSNDPAFSDAIWGFVDIDIESLA